jgi:hypothetical protein
MVAGSCLVVVIAVIATVVAVRTGKSKAVTPATSSTSSTHLRTAYRPTSLSGVTDGPDGLWVIDDSSNRLVHVNPTRGDSIGRPVAMPGRPTAVTDGSGKLWVASSVADSVEAVDPKTARITSTTPVPAGPVSLSIGGGCLWVASVIAGSVSCLDTGSGSVTATITLPDGAVRLSADGTGVWVTGSTNTLTRVTPANGTSTSGTPGTPGTPGTQPSFMVHTVQVGNGPIGLAVTASAVWVANASDGSVTEVDRASLQSLGTFRIGTDPVAIAPALDGDHLWVADGVSHQLYSIDEPTGTHITDVGTLPGAPRQLLNQGGTVWAALGAPGALVSIDGSGR